MAERVLAIRIEHQSGWTDAQGNAAEWHEVADARRAIADLRRLGGLDDQARAKLASLAGSDADVERLYDEGKYAQAQAIAERRLGGV